MTLSHSTTSSQSMTMFLYSLLSLMFSDVQAEVLVGDIVCVEGFIMDYSCIENVFLFDNWGEETLKRPDLHTIHCLVDVAICVNSAFEILTPPPQGSDKYIRGWRVTEQTKTTLIDIARTVGDPDNYCSTCKGGGLEQQGFRATIKAQVKALADEANDIPPIIAVLEAYSSSVVDPTTFQSSLIAESPCQHFFRMDEFGIASAAETTPTTSPTAARTSSPTNKATIAPTVTSTMRRTSSPTMVPVPSETPSSYRTSIMPSDAPSDLPSIKSSASPSASPIFNPIDESDPSALNEVASSSSSVADTESLNETIDTPSDAAFRTTSIVLVTLASIFVTLVII